MGRRRTQSIICRISRCGRKSVAKSLCSTHYQREYRGRLPLDAPVQSYLDDEGWGAWRKNKAGYVYQQRQLPNRKFKVRYQHRVVMSQMLGRALIKGETVHHKNGVRSDNRPENLELWVTAQPSGQRPEDLLAWADEIISRYRTPPID